MSNRAYLFAGAIGLLGYVLYAHFFGFHKYPAGTIIRGEPLQGDDDDSRQWTIRGFTVQSMATYDIRCRVILKDEYSTQSVAKLSPLDFTVTWGTDSDQTYVDKVRWSHSDRYASFNWDPDFPLTTDYFMSHVANMHLIPRDDDVAGQLQAVRMGSFIEMKGYLVRVLFPDGTSWKSSMSRTDVGDGACELMLVNSVAPIPDADLSVETPRR